MKLIKFTLKIAFKEIFFFKHKKFSKKKTQPRKWEKEKNRRNEILEQLNEIDYIENFI